MKSLKFFKPTLAIALAIVLLSVRPAQAGYTVTLQQVGPNVVATGSGTIDLTGLTFSRQSTRNPEIQPNCCPYEQGALIFTGPTSSSVDFYVHPIGPNGIGSGTNPAGSAAS